MSETPVFDLSDAQKTAIYTHDRNVIVVAGAGSGKTFVLVERYLALLEKFDVGQIVAITFTNKAAREMRDRVRSRLIKRAADEIDQRDLWVQRLSQIDSARIKTIHAFCGDILRASAAEARLDPDFEVLEEDDAGLLKEDALGITLKAMSFERDPALELIADYGEKRVREALLANLSGEPLVLPDNLLDHWMEQWEKSAERILDALPKHDVFSTAYNWLQKVSLPQNDAIADVWRSVDQCMYDFALVETIKDKFDLAFTLSESINLKGGSAKTWGDKESFDEGKALLKAIRETAQAALKRVSVPPTDAVDQRAAEMVPLWSHALDRVRATYAALKAERAALDFDDLERRTRALLVNDADVRARYRVEFKHLLVDEFQDTNRAQWEIVTSLMSGLAPDSTADGARGLFMVGDPKQSIYAFRGADVTVFEQARDAVRTSGGEVVALSASYRTHKRLIDLFNGVFSQLLMRETPDALYQVEYGEPMTANRVRADSDPCIYLDIGVHPYQSESNEDDRADQRRRREAARIARWIQTLVDEQRPIYDKDAKTYRPIAYGDFAVLFRRMRHVTQYEDVFKEHDLPYVTLAGRGFYDRQEVWDILNLLRALVNPGDALALTAALRSPLFNLSDEVIFALRLPDDEGDIPLLWDALTAPPVYLPDGQREAVEFAAQCLRKLRALAGRVTIAELLIEIAARTGYLATLTALPDGARRRGNVEKVIDKARDSGRITLGAFTRYLDELSEREIREGEAALDISGAIQIMTLHASKGLEFPAVILADCGAREHQDTKTLIAFDPPSCKVYDQNTSAFVTTGAFDLAAARKKAREDAENRRLLYVAATRAADVLLISGQIAQTQKGLSPQGWLKWVCGLTGIEEIVFDGRRLLAGAWDGVCVDGYDADMDLPHPPTPSPRGEREIARFDAFVSLESSVDGTELAGSRVPSLHMERGAGGEVVPTTPPALLAPVRLRRDAAAKTLTATQIADLGCAFDIEDERERAYYRERWRRGVLRDAPHRVETIQGSGGRFAAKVIGEIVHRALRWWQKGSTQDELRAALDAYAWEQGILDEKSREDAVDKALILLQNVTSSPIHQRIERAQQVFREVPFVYRTDKRQITGVIDALIQTAEGRWQVVDYKTSTVHRRIEFAQHARRYWIQVGVYAAAALQLLSKTDELAKSPLEVYIHYIRYATTVKIEAVDWQGALARLEPCIGELIDEDD